MIREVTAVTLFASLVMAVVVGIGYTVTTYAPLWLQIVSIPVTVWLVALAVITLVHRGVLDRWTS